MANNPFNGTIQIIDINGSGGAYVNILATGPLRRFRITESLLKADGSTAATPQGLTYTLFGGTQVFELPAASVTNEPGNFPEIEVPEGISDASFHGWQGNVIGNGADTPGAGVAARTATVLASVRSATATATAVKVEQYY